MKKLFVGLAVAATMTLSACSSSPAKSGASMGYEATIAEAKALHAESAANGNVWKQKKMKKAYVDHYVAEAEAAKKAGDDAKAMSYADKALKSAKAELSQYKENENLKPLWIK